MSYYQCSECKTISEFIAILDAYQACPECRHPFGNDWEMIAC